MGSLAYNQRKAREWENATAKIAQQVGFDLAERRRLEGRYDRGDISGIPRTVIECKNGRTVTPGQAVDEAREEGANANALIYAAAKKRERYSPEQGFFITDLEHGLRLVQCALIALDATPVAEEILLGDR